VAKVVAVEVEARKLVNGLPKQQKLQVGCPHIPVCKESSTKQCVKPVRLVLPSFCFNNLFLLLNSNLARSCSVTLVFTTEQAIDFPGLIPISSSKAPATSAPWSWRPERTLLLP
jgi:hypothetical protein